ncbi:hypothetical protein [Pseudobacillus badius]|uniref:hypothetical protein n=1 Tax=Bacillus badius TaxID=1455 RepID=UPI0007B3AD7F|nr:hypothetical protein [Bacillus badius]KZR57525.1 hypothetical protein A3781_19730 [Bacillus badius]
MSSQVVYQKLQDFFPEGLVLDTSGNCFNLFLEFPTADGQQASVLIWEENVLVYCKDGKFLSKEEYYALNEGEDDDFRQYEEIIFSLGDIEYDDEDNRNLNPSGNEFFTNNTMIEVGKAWEKFNRCFRKALGYDK